MDMKGCWDTMDNERKQEFTRRITNANKTQLVVILFDMCFEYLYEAQDCCKKKDIENLKEAVRKGQQVIRRLEDDLNFEYKLSYDLMSLYAFAEKELVKCLIDLKEVHALDVKKILVPIREGFSEVAKSDTSGPMMKNTESVYAGMTYGKGALNEAVDTGSRGFFA